MIYCDKQVHYLADEFRWPLSRYKIHLETTVAEIK